MCSYVFFGANFLFFILFNLILLFCSHMGLETAIASSLLYCFGIHSNWQMLMADLAAFFSSSFGKRSRIGLAGRHWWVTLPDVFASPFTWTVQMSNFRYQHSFRLPFRHIATSFVVTWQWTLPIYLYIEIYHVTLRCLYLRLNKGSHNSGSHTHYSISFVASLHFFWLIAIDLRTVSHIQPQRSCLVPTTEPPHNASQWEELVPLSATLPTKESPYVVSAMGTQYNDNCKAPLHWQLQSLPSYSAN